MLSFSVIQYIVQESGMNLYLSWRYLRNGNFDLDAKFGLFDFVTFWWMYEKYLYLFFKYFLCVWCVCVWHGPLKFYKLMCQMSGISSIQTSYCWFQCDFYVLWHAHFTVLNHLPDLCVFFYSLDGKSCDEYIKTRCFIRELFYVSKLNQK